MKYIAALSIFILFGLLGCSQKNTPNPHDEKIKQSSTTPIHSLKTDQDSKENIETFDAEFETEFTTQERDNESDPLEGYNRAMTSFNDIVFLYALNPVAKAYAYVIPDPIRIGVSNFLQNINFPIRFTNNLLQGKFQNVSDEVKRFIINSTFGFAGVTDPAKTYINIPSHKEDFGQTLGYYGVGPGFHIVLPFLGPSNLRDLTGMTLDAYLSPLVNVRGLDNYKIPKNLGQSVGIAAFYIINDTSLNLGQYESIKKDAIDLYPFLRDIYEQKRVSDIQE